VPVYAFYCPLCNDVTVLLLKLGDTADRPCPTVGCDGTAKLKMSRVAVRYQSFGFTSTDKLVQDPERKNFDDRQLDAILERLDALRTELERLNSRLDHTEGFLAVTHELRTLNESLQALAYAALGQQGPQVRRRRTG